MLFCEGFKEGCLLVGFCMGKVCCWLEVWEFVECLLVGLCE
jgi:hypothetical protein